MKKKISIFCICIWLMLLTSCVVDEKKAPISIDDKYVNQQIIIRAPSYANTFKTKDFITLELKYNSNNVIVFPNNYNVRIFEEMTDAWVEIKEKPTERIPSGEIVLSPEKYLPAVQVVAFFPDLPKQDRAYSLRVYVIGQMKEKGEIKDVAAFTHIDLNP